MWLRQAAAVAAATAAAVATVPGGQGRPTLIFFSKDRDRSNIAPSRRIPARSDSKGCRNSGSVQCLRHAGMIWLPNRVPLIS